MKNQLRLSIVISGILALGLSGCVHHHIGSSNLIQPDQTLEQAPECCSHFSELAYKKLPEKFKANLVIDDADPIFEFQTGRSYAEPILLPKYDSVILLQIDSFISRPLPNDLPTVFFPAITLLDENHQHLATLDQLPFEYRHNFALWRKIRLVATIDRSYGDAKYAVIHTTNERLSQGLSTHRPVSVVRQKDFDSMLYGSPTKPRKRVVFSETGLIQILAFPIQTYLEAQG